MYGPNVFVNVKLKTLLCFPYSRKPHYLWSLLNSYILKIFWNQICCRKDNVKTPEEWTLKIYLWQFSVADDGVYFCSETDFPHYFQSSCTIDVTYFPFDQQTCIMKFGSWTFTGDQVSLSLFNNKNHVDLSDYWKSGTWDIIEVPAYLNIHNTTGKLCYSDPIVFHPNKGITKEVIRCLREWVEVNGYENPMEHWRISFG